MFLLQILAQTPLQRLAACIINLYRLSDGQQRLALFT